MEGRAVAVVEGGQIYYVRTDHIGRPVFATNDLGVKVWEAIYLPFGGVHVATGGIDLGLRPFGAEIVPLARFPGAPHSPANGSRPVSRKRDRSSGTVLGERLAPELDARLRSDNRAVHPG